MIIYLRYVRFDGTWSFAILTIWASQPYGHRYVTFSTCHKLGTSLNKEDTGIISAIYATFLVAMLTFYPLLLALCGEPF